MAESKAKAKGVWTTAAELLRFFRDPIWEDAYMDDITFEYNSGIHEGVIPEKLPPETPIYFEEGYLIDHPGYDSVEKLFRAWKKAATHVTLTITVEKEKADDLKKYAKSLGATLEGGV